jgi:hypothetical protein
LTWGRGGVLVNNEADVGGGAVIDEQMQLVSKFTGHGHLQFMNELG